MESSVSASNLVAALSREDGAWRGRNRGGAIGGRGFHFQDAVLAWLLAQGLVGQLPVRVVVPEGFDDASIVLGEAVIEVQVKSRQPHLGSVPSARLAEWVIGLGRRHLERLQRDDARRLVLVVERGVPASTLDRVAANVPELRELLDTPLATALGSEGRELVLERLHVLVVDSPLIRAAAAIEEGRRLGPATAMLAAQRLTSAVAAAADTNALPSVPAAGFTVTDASAIVERVAELVDVEQLDQAVAAGLCESVDFSQPDIDGRYLLGVATTPGHVAAGMVVDRPNEVNAVKSVLSANGQCLIVGPSGQGKSALAWLSVHATRHIVRWYRIRVLPPDGPASLARLSRSLAASAASPVGFVIDDVGRLGPSAWDALVEEVRLQPGVVLLGTCREDDVHALRTLPHLGIVRPRVEQRLAKEIWSRLRTEGETSWEGWAEPLDKSRELLLEYTHLLTEGQRLETVVSAQVRQLLFEGRESAVTVLRIVAVADLLGVALSVAAIARISTLTEQDIRRDLRRLLNELLVRVQGDVVGGLHELRSRAASGEAHDQGFADVKLTVASVLEEVAVGDLPNAVRRAADLVGFAGVLVQGLARRVEKTKSAHDLAAALHGLRLVEQDLEAQSALARLSREVPTGELAEAVWTRLGGRHLHDSVVVNFGLSTPLNPPAGSIRAELLESLGVQLGGLTNLGDPSTFAQLLSGLAGTSSPLTEPAAVQDVASRLALDDGDATAALDAARVHGTAVHQAVVDGIGGTAAAIATLATSCAGFKLSSARLLNRAVAVMVRADHSVEWWRGRETYRASDVVAAVAGEDELSIVGVDELDRPIPHLDWMPELPHTLLPSHVSPHTENRLQNEWRAAVLAAAGTPRWTDRLSREAPLLPQLASALEELLVCVAATRATPTRLIRRFDAMHKRATSLPPPPAERIPTSQEPRAPFGADAEPDPVVALVADPSRLLLKALRDDPMLAAVIAHRLWRIASDLHTAGRWILLPNGDEAELACARAAGALYALRAVASEQCLGDRRGRLSIRAAALRTPAEGVPAAAAEMSRRAGDERLQKIAKHLGDVVSDGGTRCSVAITAVEVDHPAIVWPPGKLVATLDLASASQWTDTVAAVVAARNKAVEPNRAVAVVVQINGNVSGHLSGEVGQAWWARKGVPTDVGIRPAPEPRGDAYSEGLAAAADLRWGRGHLHNVPTGTAAAQRVADAVADAERRRDLALGELAALGCIDAGTVLTRLAEEGSPADDLVAEADRLRLELADLDLCRPTPGPAEERI